MKPATLKTLLLFTFSLGLLAYGFRLLSPVYAQSAYGLTAIPPRLEFTVSPGKAVSHEIKIRNESTEEKNITISIKDYIVTDNKGTPVAVDEKVSNRWSAASWVQVSPTRLRLRAGETKSLMVSILAPDNALPGGHYAMVLETANNDVSFNQTGAAIEANVGTLLYITVPGAITEDARITSFDVPFFSEFGPITLKTTVANFSDIHIAPQGIIAITNWLGGKTANLDLVPTNIFPGASRDFTNTLDRKWLFGRYKAQFLASYGTTGQALAATVFFWVIPWRLILLSLTIIVLVALIIVLNNQKKRLDTLPPTPSEPDPELNNLKKKYKDK